MTGLTNSYILLNIFQFLEALENERNELVCKTWKELIHKSYKILPLHLIKYGYVLSKGLIQITYKGKNHEKSVDVDGRIDNQPEHMQMLKKAVFNNLYLVYRDNKKYSDIPNKEDQENVDRLLESIIQFSGRNIISKNCIISISNGARIKEINLKKLFMAQISTKFMVIEVEYYLINRNYDFTPEYDENNNYIWQNMNEMFKDCQAFSIKIYNRARIHGEEELLNFLQRLDDSKKSHMMLVVQVNVQSYEFFDTLIKIFCNIPCPETLIQRIHMNYDSSYFGDSIGDLHLNLLSKGMIYKGTTPSIDRTLSNTQTFTYYYKRADDWVLEMEFDRHQHFYMQIISPVMEATPEHNHYLKYLK